MTTRKSHNTGGDNTGRNNTGRDPLPGTFRGQEERDARMLWEKSAGLSSMPDRFPSRKETESALHSVHRRLGWTKKRTRILTFPRTIRIAAAAALVLIAFGIGYLLTPQTVTAPYGEMTSATLPDGSHVELNSGTTIHYDRLFGLRNREVSIDGEAFFSVEPGGQPFVIRANRSVVEVTGTAFNIRSRSDEPRFETRVHVTDGSVSLYPAGNPDRKVTLDAGNWSRWNETMTAPMPPEPADIDQVAGWRENRFTFRNESLGIIFREIERRFDIRIQLEAEQAASEILTAHYSDPGDPEKIIEDICHVKGLRYSKTANGFRIYR